MHFAVILNIKNVTYQLQMKAGFSLFGFSMSSKCKSDVMSMVKEKKKLEPSDEGVYHVKSDNRC